MKEVRGKSSKIVWFLLAIFVLVAGIRFENNHADSSFAYPSERETSRILLCHGVIDEGKVCTAEMLENHNNTGLQRTACRYINPKREVRLLFCFLCEASDCISRQKFYAKSEITQFFYPKANELVTTYIHKSDGKKQI